MDYKKNNIRNQPNTSGTSHFTESNAGHISVKTTSPFLNKKRDSEYTVTEQDHNKSKKNSGSILNKKLPKDIASGTSKMLINQILGDGNIDRDVIINKSLKDLNEVEQTCNYDENFVLSNVEFKYSTPTFNSKSFSMQPGSCSGEDSIEPSKTSTMDENCKEYFQINNATCSKNIIQDKQYAEKTTYCRPSRNYNLDFINKTVERNNKLQRLVKKLIDVRKKEKQTEAWNNYVNELKNKHGYGDNGRYGFVGHYTFEESAPLKYIDDYYNTQFTSKPSNGCKDLLNEFYDSYNTIASNQDFRYQVDYRNQKSSLCNYKSYLNYPYCYPMSSQGRLMMLSRERNKGSFGNECLQQQLPKSRPFYRSTIFVDKEPTRLKSSCCKGQSKKIQKTSLIKKFNCSSFPKKIVSTSMQTQNGLKPSVSSCGYQIKNTREESTQNEYIQEDNFKDSYCRVSENVERLKKRIQETCNVDTCRMQQNVLQSIESKLDSLLNSINSFMDEVKSKACVNKCSNSQSVFIKPLNSKNFTHIPISRSDTFGLIKAERLVCGCATQERPITSVMPADRKLNGKLLATNVNQVLIKDIQNVKDIDSIFSEKVVNCSVQISVDIPTKERSTEVTDSLSKAVFQLEEKPIYIEEIKRNSSGGDQTISIAVNTDPLGLLALLRVSTEAVRQLLSYMPNIPYHHYLSMINSPQRTEVSHYVCNICGAAFVRPSQLSDHIKLHDLGKTRDCCVCRHVLDIQQHRPPGLFRCRHCGQRFTRAYCCELHQESCARRLGTRHDVAPSLMFLK